MSGGYYIPERHGDTLGDWSQVSIRDMCAIHTSGDGGGGHPELSHIKGCDLKQTSTRTVGDKPVLPVH